VVNTYIDGERRWTWVWTRQEEIQKALSTAGGCAPRSHVTFPPPSAPAQGTRTRYDTYLQWTQSTSYNLTIILWSLWRIMANTEEK
jgi:hypothetical protein